MENNEVSKYQGGSFMENNSYDKINASNLKDMQREDNNIVDQVIKPYMKSSKVAPMNLECK